MTMKTINILAAAVLALSLSSCMKSKLELTYNSQEERIDSYISSKGENYRSLRIGGANRLVLKEGEGEELKADGFVSFYYAGYTFTGSITKQNLFVTNHQPTAEASGFALTDPDYELYEINLGEAELIEGLRNGLEGVRAGEMCEILFSGKYAFGNSTFGIIPANSALAFQIWVVGVSND